MTIDKDLVAARFAKAAGTYDEEAEVQRLAARRLLALVLGRVAAPIRSILEAGCGTGFLSRALHSSLVPERMIVNDICPSMRERLRDLLEQGVEFRPGDAETESFGAGFDLVISSSAVQWFNDPEAFVARCRDVLNPGGCLAIGTYGPENMRQIARFTGMGLTYKSLREWTSLFGDSWQVVAAEEEIVEKPFSSPMEALRHLRRTGVTGTGRYLWTADKLRRFAKQCRRDSDGGTILTYHPLYVVARKTGIPPG